MSVAAGLGPDWKQWEGENVDGRFPLERLLMEIVNGAVFLTRAASAYGAIKLIHASDVDEIVECWSRAQPLDHPHMIRIFKVGAWTRAGETLAYVVTEYADENLAMVLKERALTPNEVSEMVGPLVDTLAFLHERGTTLGGLEPSQICAVQDTLKISSGILAGGDGSADVRGLAATVTEALTQKSMTLSTASEMGIAESLPEPFRELARKCLDPTSCSATELARWWRTKQKSDSPPSSLAIKEQPLAPPRANRAFAILAMLIIAFTIGLLLFKKHQNAPVPVPSNAVTAGVEPPAMSSAPRSAAGAEETAAKPTPAPIPKPESPAAHPARAVHGQIVHQVLPEIPAKARRTIHGKATVIVSVVVDQSGRVTEAILEEGSRYFGRLATEAARKWQFASSDGRRPREYYLRFEITRTDIRAVLRETPDAK